MSLLVGVVVAVLDKAKATAAAEVPEDLERALDLQSLLALLIRSLSVLEETVEPLALMLVL